MRSEEKKEEKELGGIGCIMLENDGRLIQRIERKSNVFVEETLRLIVVTDAWARVSRVSILLRTKLRVC